MKRAEIALKTCFPIRQGKVNKSDCTQTWSYGLLPASRMKNVNFMLHDSLALSELHAMPSLTVNRLRFGPFYIFSFDLK